MLSPYLIYVCLKEKKVCVEEKGIRNQGKRWSKAGAANFDLQ